MATVEGLTRRPKHPLRIMLGPEWDPREPVLSESAFPLHRLENLCSEEPDGPQVQ